MLLHPETGPFVIDWSNAHPGDYRRDLAWTRLILRVDDRPDRGESLLRSYSRLVGKEVEAIGFFEVAAGVRLLSSTLLSIHHGAARQGMRPEAEALMRRGVSHALYVARLLQRRTGLPMADLEEELKRRLSSPVTRPSESTAAVDRHD